MNLLRTTLFLAILFAFTYCNSAAEGSDHASTPESEEVIEPKIELPAALKAGLQAHGGLDRWNELQTLSFTKTSEQGPEVHLVNLKNRKTLITGQGFNIGFDGQEVWVAPNKKAYAEGKRSARFYHNLLFYFYAMPFVLADPGINYEVLPEKTINGKVYEVVKVSYKDGVGDSPEDYYIAHFDKETHQMYLLLYTVTYYSGEASDKYNALVYDDWQEVNGVKLPTSFKGYTYENGALGKERYQRSFIDVSVSEQAPAENLFKMPLGAEVDSLKQG